MPSDHVPTPDNFSGWLDTFGAELAATAIRKTANKARIEMRARCPMSGRDLEAYATATTRTRSRKMSETRLRNSVNFSGQHGRKLTWEK